MDRSFWKGKRILVTGHTGFKGSWLSLWLWKLGAEVSGYALPPPTDPSMYDLCRIGRVVRSTIADIRDSLSLESCLREARPEIVFHLAAQPIVRESYVNPSETYAVNVQGTVNLFEAVRACGSVKAVVNVTSDKCYENREWNWGYREIDPLGGHDPYSSSKACSELVTDAYRKSFFDPQKASGRGAGIATARAGNVIAGGDWARDRLVPDCLRSVLAGRKIVVRNPKAIRPWQHLFDPLGGYLLLARKLFEAGGAYSGAWNFGPWESDDRTVEWIVRTICSKWGEGASYEIAESADRFHEAGLLKLDCSKARMLLGWRPRWNIEQAIDSVLEWTRAYGGRKDLRKVSLRQIEAYSGRGGASP